MTQKLTSHMSDDELKQKRDEINDTLMDDMDNKLGSADVSADDEKKKYLAQHGDLVKDAERGQDIPSPVSDEAKDLQNEVSEQEHQAKAPEYTDAPPDEAEAIKESGEPMTEQEFADKVAASQHTKLKGGNK